MKGIEIYIVVEGQTEQTFVRDVLAPEMACVGLYLHPVLIGKPGHKGGDIRFSRAKKDIGNLLKQRQETFVSTMFDYFRIDAGWPGKSEADCKVQKGRRLTAAEKAEILEDATRNEIIHVFPEYNSERRFVPYIEMHEFEALLFSDVNILAEKSGVNPDALTNIIEQYSHPEEINDDPEKSPSKRLEFLIGGYRKVAMGKAVAASIGIPDIRRQCPHFDQWLTRLEGLRR
ncbi:DUF4276 family protein [Candidatus Electrothrix sp.]|uniref:DUF4276 family protein n=1 Tax=Candidatus Electrothrix sp. TaxID=2170559 RepID=UPI0040576ADE